MTTCIRCIGARALGLCLFAWMLPAAGSAFAQCTPQWTQQFPAADLDGTAYALLADDAGSNPVLYVGGDFRAAGGIIVNSVARWDGASWSALGSGTGGAVRTLSFFDDDGAGPHAPQLYAGGTITNGIVKWDGTSWSPVGGGLNGTVDAFCIFDDDGAGPNPPAFYVGGSFTMAGGITVNGIAKWDGTSWSALGSGMGLQFTSVYSLAVFDDDGPGPNPPALYAGGNFSFAGGVSAKAIAKWNGSSWSAVGGGMIANNFTADVTSLFVFDDDGAGPDAPALYAGGYFDTAGGLSAKNIAKWDGASWSALGSGMSDNNIPHVYSLTAFDDGTGLALHAGGQFTHAGGINATYIAKWNGSSWSAVGDGTNSIVHALTPFDADGAGGNPARLYAGGFFTAAGGNGADGIADWDGSSWSRVASGPNNGLNGPVSALKVFDDDGTGPHAPALYAGGSFTSAGSVNTNGVAKWDGSSWSPLGTGLMNGANAAGALAFCAFDEDGAGPNPPALFVGGSFTSAGGVSANNIARWDGVAWSALGSGLGGTFSNPPEVEALVVFDDGTGPALFVGGTFTTAGRVSVNNIAKWNGTSWSALASGVNHVVRALAVFDDGTGAQLIAGGQFNSAGGNPAGQIARWNGTSWSSLLGGVSSAVFALTVFDDDGPGPHAPALYAGGDFTAASSVPVNYVGRWDGTSWSALGPGINGPVFTLTSFDADGASGNPARLYAGGVFHVATGSIGNFIAQWDGSAWSPLGAGMSGSPDQPQVVALAAFDDDAGGRHPSSLYAGGWFALSDGIPAFHLAKWTGCNSSITPYCPGDGTIGACPCGNSGASMHGCQNSSLTGGALLTSSGDAGLADDTLVLTSAGERPGVLSVFLQGDAIHAPVFFGDGLRCVGGTLKRLYTKNAVVAGIVTAPTGSDASVSARSAALGSPITPGAARFYQTYYRDSSLSFCSNPPGNTWNVSSGLAVVWN